MLNVACEIIPEHFVFLGESRSVLCEPTVGSVIPDLLLGWWPDDSTHLKNALTSIEAAVLAVIERERQITESVLFDEVFLPKSTARKVIERLNKIGAIRRLDKTGKLTITQRSRTGTFEVVAIELKLTRWREAIAQAIEYKNFANRSFILVDATRHNSVAKLKHDCKINNVGLLLQAGRNLVTAYKPKAEKVISAERHIAIQKLTRAAECIMRPSTSSTSEMPRAKQLDALYQCA